MIKSILSIIQKVLAVAGFLFFGLPDAIAVDPAPMQNHCPIVLVNRSTLDPSEVYFVCHGNDPDGIPCFLVPDETTGVCEIVYPTTTGTPSSAGVSKKLSVLPLATGTAITGVAANNLRIIFLPINSASRGYLSLKHPMYLATKLNPELGVLGVDDSSVTSLSDPNYYTFYQDFEFGLVQTAVADSSSRIFINLSWVDYFSLPMQLSAYEYPSNEQISIEFSALPSGTGTSETRESLIQDLNTKLAVNSEWSALAIPFYSDPYKTSTLVTYLRVLAAKNSIGLGASANQFQGAKVPQTFFPSDFISNASKGPKPSKSYVQTLYDYYVGKTLYTTIHPKDLSAVVYAITADTTNLVLKYTGTGSPTPPGYTLDLSMLTTEQLLTGANSGTDWPYTVTSGTGSSAYTNELDKLFSGLFTIGQLPLTSTTTAPGNPFDNSQYNSSASPGGFAQLPVPSGGTIAYFNNQPDYTQNLPWYNLYDLAIHTLPNQLSKGKVPENHNSTLGLGYGYDFDDLLNLAGLIALDIQDLYGNPSEETNAIQPYIVMSVEQLDPTKIPDIDQDTYSYPVTIEAAPNGATVEFSHYNGSSTIVTTASTTTSTDLGTVVVDSTNRFTVTFTFDSIDYTYDINLMRQIVTPSTPTATYSAADEQYQGSFTFKVTGGETPSFELSYNSSPPTWPG